MPEAVFRWSAADCKLSESLHEFWIGSGCSKRLGDWEFSGFQHEFSASLSDSLSERRVSGIGLAGVG